MNRPAAAFDSSTKSAILPWFTMLHLPGRSGARWAGTSSHYLARAAGIATNNSPSVLAAGPRRLISTSPRKVQQATASVRVEEQYEGNAYQSQKAAAPRGDLYWQKVGIWKDVPEEHFLNYQWQVNHSLSAYLLFSPSNYCRSRIRFKERASCFNSWRAFSLRNYQLPAMLTHHFLKSRPEMTSSARSRRPFALPPWLFASRLTLSVWLTGTILLRTPFAASSSL